MKCLQVIFKFQKTDKNATFGSTLTQITCTFYVLLVPRQSELKKKGGIHKRFITVPNQRAAGYTENATVLRTGFCSLFTDILI